jgi:hypothetical protein
MFLISVPDLEDPSGEIPKLLNTYVVGMRELGARTQDQHLVVVYTKAEEMASRLNGWSDLRTYLVQSSADGLLAQTQGYVQQMHRVSGRLREFTQTELNAEEFLHMADHNFASVTFSIISALGARPQRKQLLVGITPRRVLDPLLWMMEKSLSGWKQSWRRWRG